ncbi:transcriptional regulator [Streptomyces sp. NP160]|uniref:MarR family transcriptional regulator n=1 Tax=Streptomyces sp. NP160 TaxID=2586637 RepID=UPI00111B5645|nr:MarR family transcriptional regulator [Streptomyces sp. NP160]TNM68791.1 transcriptional regulator [Streptomyces sp. NP160]
MPRWQSDSPAVEHLIDALHDLGIKTAPASDPDLGFDVVVQPGDVRVQVKHRSLVDGAAAERLVANHRAAGGAVLVVVGDRITRDARQTLSRARAGYLDLRGHLSLRADQLVLDTDVSPVQQERVDHRPLAGRAGLDVAVHLLMHPDAVPVRRLAQDLDRSPSTVSVVLKGLRALGLVDEHSKPDARALFQEVAASWRAHSHSTRITHLPDPDPRGRWSKPLQINASDTDRHSGWALTGNAAAAELGAPVAVREDDPLDFYVPSAAVARRAEKVFGVAVPASRAQCTIRVAPVDAACSRRVAPPARPSSWPLAHPLFVALELAQDGGRGREVLESWTPDARWVRVW